MKRILRDLDIIFIDLMMKVKYDKVAVDFQKVQTYVNFQIYANNSVREIQKLEDEKFFSYLNTIIQNSNE